MNNAMPLVYNPREESREVLEQMFVGRDDILKELQDDLVAQISSATRQHWLIRGPRGMGKTHLVAVLYHRIRHTPSLSSRLLPVWLGEAAVYDAYSAGVLVLGIASRLVEELELQNDPRASELSSAIADIPHAGDAPALFNDLCELLKTEAKRRGRILVILMENLDAWLESISGDRGAVEAGRLRSLLSDDKEFLFISTTPTHYLPKLSKPGSPLFGHLRERRLQPLSEDHLRDLFGRLERLTGRAIGLEDDAESPDARLRWRVLHRLAGGNPRAAVMAFSVISGPPGIKAMVDELARLLDAQTPYYETRLARLAPRERAIVKAMALSPHNLTISEMATLTRLPERSLSTQVKRLLDEGHIAPAGDQHGKGSVFELTDGLFRIWYHYRGGRRVLEPLVRFLAVFHTQQELESALKDLSAELVASRSAVERDLLESTTTQVRSALDYARTPVASEEREQLWTACEREIAEEGSRELNEYLVELEAVGRVSNPEAAQRCAERVIAAVRARQQSWNPAEVIAGIDSAADILVGTGQLSGAIEALRDVIARFGNATEPASREAVARAMVNLGITLGQAGRVEEATASFRDVIARFGDAAEPALRELVALAMFNHGVTLGQAGLLEEEMASFRDVIARFGDAPEPALREQVAEAMVNHGVTLGRAGRVEEEMATYRDVIARFGDAAEPALREQVARAMLILGIMLVEGGRLEEAAANCRDLFARFADTAELPLREQVARVMLKLSLTLGQAGRIEEEMATYRDLIARFGDAAEPALREEVARAVLWLGVTLGQAGRVEEEMATYRDLIARFGDAAQLALREQVARAMFNLGGTLGQVGRVEEEMATYRDLIDRFGDAAEPALREQVARATLWLGITLGQAGRVEEEMATYHDLIDRFGDAAEPALREQVAPAMLILGMTLMLAGRFEEAIAAYRDLIARFGDAQEPEVRVNVAEGAVNLAQALSGFGRHEGAIQAASRAIDLCGPLAGERSSRFAGTARLLLANSLHALRRHAEGSVVLSDAARQLAAGAAADLPIAEEVVKALLIRAPLAQAEELLRKIQDGAQPDIREMARLYGFVLALLRAEEPATHRVKSGPAIRRRRALERVPRELRSTVIEKADNVKQERAKLKA
jgi:tetratricopeptide (TPR) repeat protein